MSLNKVYYTNILTDLKTDEEIIVIDPEAEYENMIKQGKVFVEADESGFINPLICK